jgi:PAS domain S-box-containing protein
VEKKGLGLSATNLSVAFPFHIAFDHANSIVQIGPALTRLFPSFRIGQKLQEYFQIIQPRSIDWKKIDRLRQSLFVIEVPCNGLRLQGQVIHQSGIWLFLGSPRVQETAQLSSLGLQLSDFALHDPVVDYLLLLQAQKTALKEMKDLTIEMRNQRTLLKQVNQELLEVIELREGTEEALRKSQVKLARAQHIAQIGSWEYDMESGEVFWSDELCEIYGLANTQQPLIGSELHDQFLELIRPAILSGRPYEKDLKILRQDNEIRHVEIRCEPVFHLSGVFIGLSGIMLDITVRKRAEEEVHQALAMERELGELKSRFISMASHEFRTPLGMITFSASMLERYAEGWDVQHRLKHLLRIQRSAQRITGLLEDVLILGRLESGKLHCEPILLDPQQLCKTVIEELAAAQPLQHHLKWLPGELTTGIYLDESLVRPVLSNLLTNAIKYSSPDTTITLRCWSEDLSIGFQISDQGIGIPPEDLRRLFEPFHRGSNVGTIPGTGLGLAIVKRFVELHGGKLSVESTLGKGSDFIVYYPSYPISIHHGNENPGH